MILIAAVDRNWSIGYRGKLLVQIPADQQIFRNETMGKIIVMGRKTFESIQGGRPLPGRTSFVLSADPEFQPRSGANGSVKVFRSAEALKEELEKYGPEEVYLIGGGQMYHQFLPLCQKAEITWIDYAYDADTRCPDLDKSPEWKLVRESEEQIYFSLEYYFRTYERIDNRP